MKQISFLLPALLLLLAACRSSRGPATDYQLLPPADAAPYASYFSKAKRQVEAFWGNPFPRSFNIVVHENRAKLDSCWQRDWKMPEFHSECWMVASGVARKLDLLSPKSWSREACEHHWEDSIASLRLIAHEMTHVYHGQYNVSPDFSDVDRIDWFVEGLAVFASGQCDAARLAGVKTWLATHPAPPSLDNFWSGKQKYGLSGSVVMFLDERLGRKKIFTLLPINKKAELLQTIGMTEAEILKGWAEWLEQKNK